jgi:hypothetical protein
MDFSRRTVLGALAAAGSTAGCLGSVGGSGAEGLPTLVLFDRSGQERWRHVGLAGTDSLRSEVRGASKG